VDTENVKNELRSHLTAAREIAAKAEAENREYNDTERTALTELMGKANDAKAKLDRAKADDAVKAAMAGLGDEIGLNEKSGDRATPSGLIVPGRKSIGQHYVDSGEYKGLIEEAVVSGGDFRKNQRINVRPVGFKNLVGPQGSKALVTGTSDTSGGAFVRADDLGLQVGMEPFQRPLTLRNLVTNGTTTSDSIEYVRVTSITNNAAPVAEASSAALPGALSNPLTNAALGGYKPESGMAVARYSTPVRTIAHWIPVTKRALADAAQMVTLIDGFLEYGLEEELEDQMIAGDGSGENFEGLANVSGVQSQAFDNSVGGDVLSTLRKAKTKVQLVGRANPNGYVMNPADLETIDLLKDNEGRFYGSGPFSAGVAPSLWGLPIVQSEAVPAGTAYVGAWDKAILWDRQSATITTTDSHGDFFVRNLVAILAEARMAFGVLQPNAFVEIDLTA
jgi:HK97 family phage major capsid protein